MLEEWSKRYLGMPHAATAAEWAAWRRRAKAEHPWLYWLLRTLPQHGRRLGRWAQDWVWWVRHRTTHRYHVIPTGLPPGYYDKDTQLLHAAFQLLVDYVEGEAAHMMRETGNEAERKRWRQASDREAGLAYLAWERSLTHGNTMPPWARPKGVDPDAPTQQAESAREIETLYRWWTEVRPARPTYEQMIQAAPLGPDEDAMDLLARPETPEHRAQREAWWAEEERQREEDTEMLVRLVRVRAALWV